LIGLVLVGVVVVAEVAAAVATRIPQPTSLLQGLCYKAVFENFIIQKHKNSFLYGLLYDAACTRTI
jgi:hypothetical protein